MANFMNFIFISMAIFVTGTAAAPPLGPNCDMMGLMPCIMPFMAYGQDPEAQQIRALQEAGREMEITESQAIKVCKLLQGLATCASDYLTRCVPADVVDVHELTRGTVELMKVCDKPGMYAQGKILAACTKSLNNTSSKPVLEACAHNGKEAMPYLKNRDPNEVLDILRSGRVLKDMCCLLKTSFACMKPEISKCSSQAVFLQQQVYDAIMKAYNCEAKTSGGCPVDVSSSQNLVKA